MEIRQVTSDDQRWIHQTLADHWGSALVVSRGKIYHADQLPGFTAFDRGEKVGLVTYSINDAECEIVTLNSLQEDRGVGTSLLNEVVATARQAGCLYIRVVTTNDNHRALRFYQKRGFIFVALHRASMEHARTLKPEIPLIGIDGIPIRDELELELSL